MNILENKKTSHAQGLEKINIVEMAMLLKAKYRLNAVPPPHTHTFQLLLHRIRKKVIKFVCKHTGLQISKIRLSQKSNMRLS